LSIKRSSWSVTISNEMSGESDEELLEGAGEVEEREKLDEDREESEGGSGV